MRTYLPPAVWFVQIVRTLLIVVPHFVDFIQGTNEEGKLNRFLLEVANLEAGLDTRPFNTNDRIVGLRHDQSSKLLSQRDDFERRSVRCSERKCQSAFIPSGFPFPFLPQPITWRVQPVAATWTHDPSRRTPKSVCICPIYDVDHGGYDG